VLVFGWFFWVASKIMYSNYRNGPPELRNMNNVLLSLYFARVIIFVLVFGSIHSDLYYFLGLVGFSVAMNGGVCTATQPARERADAPSQAY
jgi:hypothetical protein